MSASLQSITERYLPLIEETLSSAINVASTDLPERLGEAMNYSLLAGGKRVRPLLCLLACEAVGGDTGKAWPAASAIEQIHTYSLIHDDLPAMDDDDLRRGRPTCHKQYDEATAILAGDGLLTRAFETLAVKGTAVGLSAQQIVDSVATLAKAAGPEGMVGGQAVDLLAETRDDVRLDELIAIHRRKTGCLLTAAVKLGGIAGGANESQLAQLDIYGSSVGLAFQIADDLLDETGDAETMGKGVRKDSVRGKATYPSLLGLKESRLKAETLVDRAIEAVSTFGEAANPLKTVAEYVIRRDR